MAHLRKAGFLKRYPFAILLVALFIMLITSPFAALMSRWVFGLTAQASIAPMVAVLTISAAVALWARAKNKILTSVLIGAVLILILLSSVFSQNALTLVHLIGQLLFLIYVTTVIARDVFRAPIVDGNILCGAACLYMLTGVLMGFIFCLIEFLQPGSFRISDFDVNRAQSTLLVDPGWLIYFSFTTLTTVGLGDVLPTSPIARSFAAVEAVLGQIIVVVMIARLVGLNVAQASANPTPKKSDESLS